MEQKLETLNYINHLLNSTHGIWGYVFKVILAQRKRNMCVEITQVYEKNVQIEFKKNDLFYDSVWSNFNYFLVCYFSNVLDRIEVKVPKHQTTLLHDHWKIDYLWRSILA